MITSNKTVVKDIPSSQQPKRAEWRQRLVDAERGFTYGMRTSSMFFVYLFLDCLVVTVSVVLGLSLWQWCVIILCLTFVHATEFLYQAFLITSRIWLTIFSDHLPDIAIQQTESHELQKSAKLDELLALQDNLMHVATVSLLISWLGSGTVIVIILLYRIQELYVY